MTLDIKEVREREKEEKRRKREEKRKRKRELKELLRFLRRNRGKMFSEEELRDLGFEPESYHPWFSYHQISQKRVDSELYYYYKIDFTDIFLLSLLTVLLVLCGFKGLLVAILLCVLEIVYNEIILFKGVKG
ncbi:MAG: hypothetical protein ACXQTS_02575 [Candidatus Methanospirareceae archaeon]